MDWCTGLYDTDLAAMVHKYINVHFIDARRKHGLASGSHDPDLAAMVQNDIIVHFLDGYIGSCTDFH